jgi:hypothetical protein
VSRLLTDSLIFCSNFYYFLFSPGSFHAGCVFPCQLLLHIVSTSHQLQPKQRFCHEVKVCLISSGRFHFLVSCKERRITPSPQPNITCASPFANFVIAKMKAAEHKQDDASSRPSSSSSTDASNTNGTSSVDDDDHEVVYWCNKPLVIEAVDLEARSLQ